MKVIIYGQPNCSYCSKAVFLARMNKVDHEYKNLNEGNTREEMFELIPAELHHSIRSVPQIFADGMYIGGFTEFERFMLNKKQVA